jgi:hypothetical protein
MAYFAKIESGTVTRVIVAEQSFVDELDGVWVETFSSDIGGNEYDPSNPSNNYFASVGYLYDASLNKFQPPPPSKHIETDPAILALINQTTIVSLP